MIEPATAALSESSLPNCGRLSKSSHFFRTRSLKPSPSLPTTSATPPFSRNWCTGRALGDASNPYTHTSSSCLMRSIACARLYCAISRCSVPPDEACTTTGVIWAACEDGMITPCTPINSAVLNSEPRFCGSWIRSKSRKNGGSPLALALAKMSSNAA